MSKYEILCLECNMERDLYHHEDMDGIYCAECLVNLMIDQLGYTNISVAHETDS